MPLLNVDSACIIHKPKSFTISDKRWIYFHQFATHVGGIIRNGYSRLRSNSAQRLEGKYACFYSRELSWTPTHSSRMFIVVILISKSRVYNRMRSVRFLPSAYNWAGFMNAVRCANGELATGGPGQINMGTCVGWIYMNTLDVPSRQAGFTIPTAALSYREKTCLLSSCPYGFRVLFFTFSHRREARRISRDGISRPAFTAVSGNSRG